MDVALVVKDALRMLGAKTGDPEQEALLRKVYAENKDTFCPRAVYAVYKITEHSPVVKMDGYAFPFTGESIRRHLDGAEYALLSAFTLGIAIDKRIKELSLARPSESVALNALASSYAERVADEMLADERKKLEAEGYVTNFRFCPGYGDLPLSTNGEIANALNAQKKIGLTVMEDGLMLPRKSMIGIVGAKKEVR